MVVERIGREFGVSLANPRLGRIYREFPYLFPRSPLEFISGR
jgi:hypothetical protein